MASILSAARKQQKLMALDAAANTFEAVAREWFEKHSANWEASYSVKLLARLEANIFPWLGDRPTIAAISIVTLSRRGAQNATFSRICAARCRPARRSITHPSLTLRAWPPCYAPSTDIAART
jgi:integrase